MSTETSTTSRAAIGSQSSAPSDKRSQKSSRRRWRSRPDNVGPTPSKGRRQPLWRTLRRPLRPADLPRGAPRMFAHAAEAAGSTATLHALRHTAAYRMAEDPELPLTDVQFEITEQDDAGPRWFTTIKGNALAGASFSKPITQDTARRHLDGLLQRVRAYNADRTKPYSTTHVPVFGTYVDPTRDRLDDLDIAIQVVAASPTTSSPDDATPSPRTPDATSTPSSENSSTPTPTRPAPQRPQTRDQHHQRGHHRPPRPTLPRLRHPTRRRSRTTPRRRHRRTTVLTPPDGLPNLPSYDSCPVGETAADDDPGRARHCRSGGTEKNGLGQVRFGQGGKDPCADAGQITTARHLRCPRVASGEVVPSEVPRCSSWRID